ncbi:hypothetical protein RHOFW104T7_14280 [Rhodanobacter thiooxydans]|uniref:Uncharacterized protein n=2 Tax=Rhodanobacter thiooxydans TaxID=416169 RepID=A0A154QGP8_9GAMM|nr:hypothetical protein UUA_00020 [Rhodanobacter thiooxydans LCS2]KZC23375.1 hypothetical protein RHOFW104T7_14280 [Rhodanobacter thiooxydans]
MAKQALAWLALLAVAALAAWLRYGLVESSAIGQLCSAGHAPWWCRWRQWLVLGFLHDVYGIAALAATALALLHRRAWAAWLAAALGAFALELYCVESGALALLLGGLFLWRACIFDTGRPNQEPRISRPFL